MATTACPLERAGPESVPWCVRPPAASRRFGYYGHLPCCIMMNHAASCCSAYVPLIAWDPTSSVEKDSKALRGINICARFTVQSTPWTVCVCGNTVIDCFFNFVLRFSVSSANIVSVTLPANRSGNVLSSSSNLCQDMLMLFLWCSISSREALANSLQPSERWTCQLPK